MDRLYFEYRKDVTVKAVVQVYLHNLVNELRFREGQQDRKALMPCYGIDGPYLDGWYDPNKPRRYITEDEEQFLKEPEVVEAYARRVKWKEERKREK